jgi:hypothetical protein
MAETVAFFGRNALPCQLDASTSYLKCICVDDGTLGYCQEVATQWLANMAEYCLGGGNPNQTPPPHPPTLAEYPTKFRKGSLRAQLQIIRWAFGLGPPCKPASTAVEVLGVSAGCWPTGRHHQSLAYRDIGRISGWLRLAILSMLECCLRMVQRGSTVQSPMWRRRNDVNKVSRNVSGTAVRRRDNGDDAF